MLKQDTPKHMKRLLREWSGIAHERELGRALSDLGAQFDRFKRSDIDAFELNAQVHQFHQHTSREIWGRYLTNLHDSAVALAVVGGVIRREEMPSELLEHLTRLIESYEAVRAST